jgi:2-polyprenyl-3-methyl-5-hydroxy-6-metoxy-1,4-benzoquinol methylase
MKWLYKVVHQCRLCDCSEMQEIVNFGKINLYTPNTGLNVKKGDPGLFTMVPLTLNLCKSCSNMQLGEIINPQFLYKNFQYKTQVTAGLKDHFELLSSLIKDSLKLKKNEKVLDIGSNDGTFLLNFIDCAKVVGVEPGEKVAAYANKRGVNTVNSYFTSELGKILKKQYGHFRVIFCANTIANIEDLHEIFDTSKSLLDKNGYLIIETQNGMDVLEHFLLDTVYHEHLSYFVYPAFQKFLDKKGFRVDHVVNHKQKGGSLQLWITHKLNPTILKMENNDEGKLLNTFKRMRLSDSNHVRHELYKKINEVQKFLDKLRGKEIFGFGASVSTNTLINLFCKNLKIKKILDDHPTVGGIPVRGELLPVERTNSSTEQINKKKILVFAYRYYDLIVKKHNSIKSNNFINIFEALDQT